MLFTLSTKRGKNLRLSKAKSNGTTSTVVTLRNTIMLIYKNVTLAPFSTIGKNNGMITMVKMLAITVYVVSEPMLPPSFSVTTATAAAVGQMKQIKAASSTSLTLYDAPKR